MRLWLCPYCTQRGRQRGAVPRGSMDSRLRGNDWHGAGVPLKCHCGNTKWLTQLLRQTKLGHAQRCGTRTRISLLACLPAWLLGCLAAWLPKRNAIWACLGSQHASQAIRTKRHFTFLGATSTPAAAYSCFPNTQRKACSSGLLPAEQGRRKISPPRV